MSTSASHSQRTSDPEKFPNLQWWNGRTELERTLCFVTVIIILVLAVMGAALSVFGYLHQKDIDTRQVTYDPDVPTNLCLTPECVKTAAYILTNLDENIDPCDDFYQFACRGWMDKHAIPEDKSSISVFSNVQDDLNLKLRVLMDKQLDGSEPGFIRMIKIMYDSCMDLKSIDSSGSDPLLKVLKSLGGWPVVEGDKWNESNFDWIDTLISFRRMGYPIDILMALEVQTDSRNNSRHIIQLYQPTSGINDGFYPFLLHNDSQTGGNYIRDAYIQLMVKIAKKLGSEKQRAEKEMNDVLKFEGALGQFFLSVSERRNESKIYNKYTVKKLSEIAPQIYWMKYFNGLLEQPILENETLIVNVPDLIIRFAKLITNTDKRVLANYMMWRVTKTSLSLLSKEWRALLQEFRALSTGKNQEKPRWEQCLGPLADNLGIALGSYYVRNYFNEESKDRVMEFVKYISKEFLGILEDVDWMDKGTKMQAIEKAKSIKSYIGYPQELLNNTLVLEFYENLTISNDSYFENIMRLRRWSTDCAFSKLRKPTIRGEWKNYAHAAVVNAHYTPLENSIKFPAGILQNFFFNKNRPHYINFGAIGNVIGHEITHGFDGNGRQFDKNGNVVNWWANTTDELFKKKARCIIEQYGNYTTENGLQLNGVNTQQENIADNGGTKVAYLAYQSWLKDHGKEPLLPGLKYTPNQLFWISVANEYCVKYRPVDLKNRIRSSSHSPLQFRVIGPMSNQPTFSKDFQCEIGTKMNPEQKCRVW